MKSLPTRVWIRPTNLSILRSTGRSSDGFLQVLVTDKEPKPLGTWVEYVPRVQKRGYVLATGSRHGIRRYRMGNGGTTKNLRKALCYATRAMASKEMDSLPDEKWHVVPLFVKRHFP